MKGCLIGSTLTGIVGVVWKVVKIVSEALARVIYYFGLYVPIAYLIYGGVLRLVFDFALFDLSVDSGLYIFGLTLSLIAAVILAARNLIVRPYNKYFRRDDVVEYGKQQRLSKSAPEAPKIYKSRVNPGVVVYEYANRYDLYEQDDDRLTYVGTEYKKGKRW